MTNAISENGLKVLNYIIEHEDEDLTADAIREALGFEKKSSVDGIVTAGLIRNRGLVERVVGGVEQTEKGVKEIKFIKVTEAGKAYDHEAALAQDLADKEAEIAAKAAKKAAEQ